jgi:hypothetical protein
MTEYLRVVLACLSLLTFGLTGCSSGLPMAEVEGQILVNGKPGDKIRVEFHPDEVKGTIGPSSVAETDAEGRFSLSYVNPAYGQGSGAVVGWHRVVLQDLRLAESETGQGVPVRFPSDYSMISTTPLEQEVKEGKQTVTITVPLK